MITGITGVLESRGPDWVQLRIGGGVSLQVHVPASAVGGLGGPGDQVHLHTRLYIRDDEAVLYGFPTPEALSLFQMLNGVSGIGPRTSLALLSSLGPAAVVAAVATGDVETLSRVPGLGKKGAGRLVLELKGKLEKYLAKVPMLPGAAEDGDAVSALMALGYTAAESRRAIASLDGAAGLPLEDKVRRALQEMARG